MITRPVASLYEDPLFSSLIPSVFLSMRLTLFEFTDTSESWEVRNCAR